MMLGALGQMTNGPDEEQRFREAGQAEGTGDGVAGASPSGRMQQRLGRFDVNLTCS